MAKIAPLARVATAAAAVVKITKKAKSVTATVRPSAEHRVLNK
jgi:hypothetical protein